jgi:DNA processing protein
VVIPDLLDPRDEAPAARAELDAWLALQRAYALRPQQAVAALAEAPEALLAGVRPVRGDAARAALVRVGAVGLPWGSARYPERLRPLVDAPPLLWVSGALEALALPAVAVVGARAASLYGRTVARALGAAFARAGLAVVSGLARGIDAEAHEGALEVGGVTVALQACGPDRLYPSQHRDLARRILERGALVTEFAPGTPPLPAQFPLRNRLISALSRAVVVVEARERSGSLGTARHAADQGVDVFAVPGPIDAPTSRGPNALLRDGARVLLEVRDVLDAIGVRPKRARAAAPAPDASPLAQAVLACLAEGPLDRDALCRRLGRAPQELAPALLELELGARVACDRDGRLRPVPAPLAR